MVVIKRQIFFDKRYQRSAFSRQLLMPPVDKGMPCLYFWLLAHHPQPFYG
jgi:hypothetical protein